MGLVLVALLAAAPSRAASASDYARLTAPDVPSAAAFLRDNLDCRVLDARSSHALLECGTGSVVEIVRGRPTPGKAPALQLRTEDADATQSWLRQRHVGVIDDGHAGNGRADGLLHVDIRTPWGQTVELVGRGAAHAPAGAPLAAD